MRVLLPQRLDVLGRSMDTNITSLWLALAGHCDLVLWGPGLRGYEPLPLDEAARHVDADVVCLPDYQHASPGLWQALWEGVERLEVPVVWHLTDSDSAVAERREVLRRVRPAALFVNNADELFAPYDDIRAEHGIPLLTVPVGFDPLLFHAGERERDIDILVCGADQPVSVYPLRKRLKELARTLGDRYRVLDLDHPGYWETAAEAPTRRGQAAFAELLRRSRLVITGTAFGSFPRKYFEAASCGAVGVGDVPHDEPDAHRFDGAMLAVELEQSDDEILAAICALLDDEPRRTALAAQGMRAVTGCDHAARAHELLTGIERVIGYRPRTHRPRPFPAPAPVLGVHAPVEPAAVAPGRLDWRHDAPAGLSRTRRLEHVLRQRDEDVCVLALDPDAALPADALLLAEQVRSLEAGVVLRAARYLPDHALALKGWTTVAARRSDLLAELAQQRGRFGPEAAVLALAERDGVQVLDLPVVDDPAAELARLEAAGSTGLIAPTREVAELALNALRRAGREGRAELAAELAGWCRLSLGLGVETDARGAGDGPAEDPELAVPATDGARFARLDPRDPSLIAAIVEHARLGTTAAPLELGVPIAAGVPTDDAAGVLLAALEAAGLDLEELPDLVVLERPLYEAELRSLEGRVRRDLRRAA
jgi:hypothetical protein